MSLFDTGLEPLIKNIILESSQSNTTMYIFMYLSILARDLFYHGGEVMRERERESVCVYVGGVTKCPSISTSSFGKGEIGTRKEP